MKHCHCSDVIVEEWQDLATEDILHAHGAIYDKPDYDESREEVDLDELPLFDEDGVEIRIYNREGFRVMRHRPVRFYKCGALIDLERIHELFQGHEDAYGHVHNETPFWVYPLAFSRKMGNVKSASVMPNFCQRLKQIDLVIRPPVDDDAMDTDDENDDVQIRGAPVLRPLGSQIYNSLSHRVRNEAKFHAVQLGMVTSTFAGSTATTVHGRRHWERRLRFCDGGLPHVRFNHKVSGPGQPQALRFENTYTLDVFQMDPQHRNGL